MSSTWGGSRAGVLGFGLATSARPPPPPPTTVVRTLTCHWGALCCIAPDLKTRSPCATIHEVHISLSPRMLSCEWATSDLMAVVLQLCASMHLPEVTASPPFPRRSAPAKWQFKILVNFLTLRSRQLVPSNDHLCHCQTGGIGSVRWHA